jgi:HEAT repeat protein
MAHHAPRLLLAAGLAAVALPLPAAAEDAGIDERSGNVFFQEPDEPTRQHIDALIRRFSTVSVQGRDAARQELEAIGYWAVAPLIEALATLEAPVRSAACLTLESIGDPRAIDPLRQRVVEEQTNPFVGAFASLALGRYRDPGAVPAIARALDSPKSMQDLRSAAPLVLARIGTDEAQELLRRRMRDARRPVRVQSAQLLAVGFFPELALHESRAEPVGSLADGFASKNEHVRAAAMLGYLVATVRRRDTREFLLATLSRESRPAVFVRGLLGLAPHPDQEVSRYLASIALKNKEDAIRIQAADLLIDRRDDAAKRDLLKVVKAQNPARLRAAAVLALASMPDEEAQTAALERLGDRTPLVRAAAAVGATRMQSVDARSRALQRIDRRLRTHGESRAAVRENLELARQVLSEERANVRWTEVGEARLFADLTLSYHERLLRHVNEQVHACLDLVKITNLTSDTEFTKGGLPDGGGGEGGEEGGEDGGGGGGGIPGAPKPGSAVRQALYHELRDLKVHLIRAPYFAVDDLPGAPRSKTRNRR